MVRGLLGVMASSPSSSWRRSQASEEGPAASGCGAPGRESCGAGPLPAPCAPSSTRDSSCPSGCSCSVARQASGCTAGTSVSRVRGDTDPVAPPSNSEQRERVPSRPAPAAQPPASPLGPGAGSCLCGGGTTRTSLGFLAMGGGFLLGEVPGPAPGSPASPRPPPGLPAGVGRAPGAQAGGLSRCISLVLFRDFGEADGFPRSWGAAGVSSLRSPCPHDGATSGPGLGLTGRSCTVRRASRVISGGSLPSSGSGSRRQASRGGSARPESLKGDRASSSSLGSRGGAGGGAAGTEDSRRRGSGGVGGQVRSTCGGGGGNGGD